MNRVSNSEPGTGPGFLNAKMAESLAVGQFRYEMSVALPVKLQIVFLAIANCFAFSLP